MPLLLSQICRMLVFDTFLLGESVIHATSNVLFTLAMLEMR